MIKVGRFLKLHFDLNQTCDIVIKQNYSICNFKAIELPYVFNSYWRNIFENIKYVKKFEFGGDWAKFSSKVCLLSQSENFPFVLYIANKDLSFKKKH